MVFPCTSKGITVLLGRFVGREGEAFVWFWFCVLAGVFFIMLCSRRANGGREAGLEGRERSRCGVTSQLK